MKPNFKKIKSWLFTLSGFLYAWMVFGNLLGEILTDIQNTSFENAGCYPYLGIFAAFGHRCEYAIFDWLWSVLVSTPRMMIILTCSAIMWIVSIPIDPSMDRILHTSSVIFKFETLLFVAAAPGFIYWWKKSRRAFWVINIIFLAMILQYILYAF